MGYEQDGFADKADMIQKVYDNEDEYHYVYMSADGVLAAATDEENERIADLTTDLKTYYEELLTKLILGQTSMDEWNTYMEELKELGLDELVSITQTRYDRAQG